MGDKAKLPKKPLSRPPVNPRPVGKENGTAIIKKAKGDGHVNPEVISK
ncbi:hypothetical protein [Methanolacinia petrolearia]|nr:hypothetical protein [Methanolacinia petrolearia]